MSCCGRCKLCRHEWEELEQERDAAQAEVARLKSEIMGIQEVDRMKDTLRLERIATLTALLREVRKEIKPSICRYFIGENWKVSVDESPCLADRIDAAIDGRVS